MNLNKLLFYFYIAIYRCSFLVPILFAIYFVLYHFKFVNRALMLNDMIIGFTGSVIITTVIDYMFKNKYEEMEA
ncbi:MAG: hypothetical protein AMXMBFR12_06530 [Candidatus Babeliales bacterium]